jgi:predicted house-cleaning noncanonical NTP pyrophosphatase (MazG superfamily)
MTVKLIRDLVPVDDGGREIGRAEGRERVARPFDKLHEETGEAHEAWLLDDPGLVGELADCLEVLRALAAGVGIPWSAVEAARRVKHRERGGFTRGRLYEAPPTAGRYPSSGRCASSHACTSDHR